MKHLLPSIVAVLLLIAPLMAQTYLDEGSEDDREFVLGPGDRIQVTIFDRMSITDEGRVFEWTIHDQGMIVLPLIGEIRAVGRTPEELRDAITEEYRQFMNSPLVQVVVLERLSRSATVFGAVQANGIYPIDYSTTVADFIAEQGGGLEQNADPERVTVLRENGELIRINLVSYYENGDQSQDFLLEDGDRVFVPKKKESLLTVITRYLSFLNLFLQIVLLYLIVNER